MVRKFLCLFAIFMAMAGCSLSPNKAADNPIATIVVERTGLFNEMASSSDETVEDCRGFVLQAAQVKQYFAKARAASAREYGHDLLPSRCSVEGTLQSSEGLSGKWKIDRARRGLIYFADGQTLYFYCNECQDDEFYEACDIECINEDPGSGT